jgi:hypothetical protein
MDVSDGLDKLDRIESEVSKQKTLKYNLEGQLEQLEKGFEEKGFDDLADVEERIEELKRLVAVGKKKFIKGYKEMERKHGSLFESIGITRTTE